jgi:uncharacterized integral membrane protein (TIGR00698 family)
VTDVPQLTRRLPGVGLALLIAALATAFSTLVGRVVFGMAHSPVGPVLLALLCGLAIGQSGAMFRHVSTGAEFAASTLLRLGIVLVGLKLSFASSAGIALRALPLVAICLFVATGTALLLARLAGMRREFALLMAIGTSICGCTAIVAASPLLRARSEETGYALACVVLVGMTGMLVYPWLAFTGFGPDTVAAGLLLGTTIHDTSQVVGSGLVYEQAFGLPGALAAATVTKLLRNLVLVVLLPALALWNRGPGESAAAPRFAAIPVFILWFLGMVLLRNAGDAGASAGWFPAEAWTHFGQWAATASEFALTTGMAGVGLGISFRRLPQLGWRPLGVAVGAAAAVFVTSWSVLHYTVR